MAATPIAGMASRTAYIKIMKMSRFFVSAIVLDSRAKTGIHAGLFIRASENWTSVGARLVLLSPPLSDPTGRINGGSYPGSTLPG
jgi:hypothetical protein